MRYTATMLPPENYNPYGAVQLPLLEQAWYLLDSDHPLLAKWLMDGLITVKKSARLLDDLELRKVLRKEIIVMAEPAGIGTRDKNGRKIAVGNIVRYMAGSRRHITQYYLVEDVPPPDIFHAMKFDEPLENGLYVRLFEVEQWGEVIR